MKHIKVYRCGKCLDETQNGDQSIYTWEELKTHEHGTAEYWLIDEPKEQGQ